MATGAMIGLAVLSAGMKVKQARDQAKAIAKQGAIQAEKGKQLTLARAAKQKASFLSSGITLNETGTPMAVLESTYNVGKADVELGISNANARARNLVRSANANAIASIGMAVAGASGGGGENMSGQSSFSAGDVPTRKPIFGGTT